MPNITDMNRQVEVVNDQALSLKETYTSSFVEKSEYRQQTENQFGQDNQFSTEGFQKYPKDLPDGAPDPKLQEKIKADPNSADFQHAHTLTPALQQRLKLSSQPVKAPSKTPTPSPF